MYSQYILKYFLNNDMVTNKNLSEYIGLSEKTVRTKIDSINLMLQDNNLGIIKKKPRVGMWLEANVYQKSKISKIVNATDSNVIQTDKSRIISALRLILKKTGNQRLTSQKLADELYLSVPTCLKVINDSKEWLSMFNIKLDVVRNKGLELSCTEDSYRLGLKNFILNLDDYHTVEESIQFFMPGLNIGMIKKLIIDTEKEWGFSLVEESFNEILIYSCISIIEISRGEKASLNISQKELNVLSHYSEFYLAEKLYQKIEEAFHITVPAKDVAFLSIQLLCSKTIDYKSSPDDSESILKEYDQNLKNFVSKMIDVISNVSNIDLTQDEELYRGLVIHLRPAMFRMKYNRVSNSDLTGYIKNEYQQTFRVSWLISVLFEQNFNLKITEDELSFITIYIQSALERNSKPVSAVLVSNSSNGINQMLCDKLKRNCNEIKSIRIQSLHDFDMYHCKENLILTTKALNNKDPRILEIDDWLNEESIKNVKSKIKLINGKQNERSIHFDVTCHELFEPDLVFTHLKVKDKKELLKYLNKKLIKRGYVTKKYIQSVFAREELTPTSIGDGVAIPHGDPNEVNTAKIVIATLEHPILWDTESVDVIFLMVVKFNNDFEINRVQAFYKQYVKLIDGIEKVNLLRSFTSNIDLYQYLIQ